MPRTGKSTADAGKEKEKEKEKEREEEDGTAEQVATTESDDDSSSSDGGQTKRSSVPKKKSRSRGKRDPTTTTTTGGKRYEKIVDAVARGDVHDIPTTRVGDGNSRRRRNEATKRAISDARAIRGNIIPRTVIRKIFRDTMYNCDFPVRIERKAMLVAQEAIERYRCRVLSRAEAIARHRKRVTVDGNDISLAARIGANK